MDVIDVNTQQALEMTLQQWVKYFTSEQREDIYNVISLEFSHTKLEDLVEPPHLVSKLHLQGFLFMEMYILFFIYVRFSEFWALCVTRVLCVVLTTIGCVFNT